MKIDSLLQKNFSQSLIIFGLICLISPLIRLTVYENDLFAKFLVPSDRIKNEQQSYSEFIKKSIPANELDSFDNFDLDFLQQPKLLVLQVSNSSNLLENMIYHLERIKEIKNMDIYYEMTKINLDTLCQKYNIFDTLNTSMFKVICYSHSFQTSVIDSIFPCAIISPLECYRESAQLAPKVPELLKSILNIGIDFSWTKNTPLSIFESYANFSKDHKSYDEAEAIREILIDSGFHQGYLSRRPLRELPMNIRRELLRGCKSLVGNFAKWPSQLIFKELSDGKFLLMTTIVLQSPFQFHLIRHRNNIFDRFESKSMETSKAVIDFWLNAIHKIYEKEDEENFKPKILAFSQVNLARLINTNEGFITNTKSKFNVSHEVIRSLISLLLTTGLYSIYLLCLVPSNRSKMFKSHRFSYHLVFLIQIGISIAVQVSSIGFMAIINLGKFNRLSLIYLTHVNLVMSFEMALCITIYLLNKSGDVHELNLFSLFGLMTLRLEVLLLLIWLTLAVIVEFQPFKLIFYQLSIITIFRLLSGLTINISCVYGLLNRLKVFPKPKPTEPEKMSFLERIYSVDQGNKKKFLSLIFLTSISLMIFVAGICGTMIWHMKACTKYTFQCPLNYGLDLGLVIDMTSTHAEFFHIYNQIGCYDFQILTDIQKVNEKMAKLNKIQEGQDYLTRDYDGLRNISKTFEKWSVNLASDQVHWFEAFKAWSRELQVGLDVARNSGHINYTSGDWHKQINQKALLAIHLVAQRQGVVDFTLLRTGNLFNMKADRIDPFHFFVLLRAWSHYDWLRYSTSPCQIWPHLNPGRTMSRDYEDAQFPHQKSSHQNMPLDEYFQSITNLKATAKFEMSLRDELFAEKANISKYFLMHDEGRDHQSSMEEEAWYPGIYRGLQSIFEVNQISCTYYVCGLGSSSERLKFVQQARQLLKESSQETSFSYTPVGSLFTETESTLQLAEYMGLFTCALGLAVGLFLVQVFLRQLKVTLFAIGHQVLITFVALALMRIPYLRMDMNLFSSVVVLTNLLTSLRSLVVFLEQPYSYMTLIFNRSSTLISLSLAYSSSRISMEAQLIFGYSFCYGLGEVVVWLTISLPIYSLFVRKRKFLHSSGKVNHRSHAIELTPVNTNKTHQRHRDLHELAKFQSISLSTINEEASSSILNDSSSNIIVYN